MKIAMVTYGYPPREPRVWTYHLAQALAPRHHVGFYVRALDARPNFTQWDDVHDGVRVRRIVYNQPDPWRYFLGDHIPQIDESFDAYLDETRPDLVQFEIISGLSATMLSRAHRRGIPSVLSLFDHSWACPRVHLVRGDYTMCPGPSREYDCVTCVESPWAREPEPWRLSLHSARLRLMRTLLDYPTVITSCSRYLSDFMTNTFKLPPGRIRVVPLGVPPFPMEGIRSPGERVRISYLGSIISYKGVHLLIEAALRLRALPIEVHVFGEPLERRYVAELKAMSDAVVYHGPYRRDELGAVLVQTDVLVVPSLAPETFSFVVREGAMAGVPIVASRIGAIPEFIRDGENGLLVTPGSVDELAAALRKLVLDPALRARLAAPSPVRTFEDYAREMEEIYTAIVR